MKSIAEINALHDKMMLEKSFVERMRLRDEIYYWISQLVATDVSDNPFPPGTCMSLYFSIEVEARAAA